MLDALRKALEFVRGEPPDEPWALDETAFEEHFGVPFSEFEAKLSSLDRAHAELYERTVEVNPEAAVTWLIFIT